MSQSAETPARPASEAARAAINAARAAGVAVQELCTVDELGQACRLFDAIWRPDPTNPPATVEFLRALAKSGNYLAGAFDAAGTDSAELIGASVAFFGPPTARAMHSHIAGVSAAAAGRGVGLALKLHQRAWAQQRGVLAIDWTFDPLVRRNAYFNLVKLGAVPVEYLTDFYGGMHDGINAGDESDRLLVRWELDQPPAAGARTLVAAEVASGAVIALGVGADGGPMIGARNASTLLVAIPADIEGLRRTDPGLSRHWRSAGREVLGGLLGEGARVTGFDRAGWYRLTRPEPLRESEP